MSDHSYNDRLFQKNIRGFLHTARFRWLKKNISSISYKTIIELGCYDGKTINYLPTPPEEYLGLDANWEDGLGIARKLWADKSNYTFKECLTPEDIFSDKRYDISVCMETIEHVPPEMAEPYIAKLASVTDTYTFISVPNEIGPLFFFKYLAKKLFIGAPADYSLKELFFQTIGQTHKVTRNEHKGFHYRQTIAQVEKHFDIISVTGIPFKYLPKILNFGVGIVAKTKK